MAVHYTATGASAHNNLVYFSRPGAQASAHLFVDKDGAIRQSVRFEDTAWAVSNFAENQRTVSVEVVSAGEDFTEAQIAALAEICAYLRATYGITRVIRHYDVTGKLCPAPFVSASKWAAITGGSAPGGTAGAAPQRDRLRARATRDCGRVRQRGGAECRAGRPLRQGPGARERDPVVISREDVRWGVATALAALLCPRALPQLPVAWLASRLDDLLG